MGRYTDLHIIMIIMVRWTCEGADEKRFIFAASHSHRGLAATRLGDSFLLERIHLNALFSEKAIGCKINRERDLKNSANQQE
jgi:hypothetical protein